MCGAIIYTSSHALSLSLCAHACRESHIGRVTERPVTADWSSSPATAIALGGEGLGARRGAERRFVWMHLLELPNAHIYAGLFCCCQHKYKLSLFYESDSLRQPREKGAWAPPPERERAFPRRRPVCRCMDTKFMAFCLAALADYLLRPAGN